MSLDAFLGHSEDFSRRFPTTQLKAFLKARAGWVGLVLMDTESDEGRARGRTQPESSSPSLSFPRPRVLRVLGYPAPAESGFGRQMSAEPFAQRCNPASHTRICANATQHLPNSCPEHLAYSYKIIL
ncbi:hypothetical protein SRHO_G00281350 [Serrasalmus rhombeus]